MLFNDKIWYNKSNVIYFKGFPDVNKVIKCKKGKICLTQENHSASSLGILSQKRAKYITIEQNIISSALKKNKYQQ